MCRNGASDFRSMIAENAFPNLILTDVKRAEVFHLDVRPNKPTLGNSWRFGDSIHEGWGLGRGRTSVKYDDIRSTLQICHSVQGNRSLKS